MNEQEHRTAEAARKKSGAPHELPKQRDESEIPRETTAANARRIRQLREAMEEILVAALKRNCFGSGVLEFTVQDGTIQEVRQRLERIDR